LKVSREFSYENGSKNWLISRATINQIHRSSLIHHGTAIMQKVHLGIVLMVVIVLASVGCGDFLGKAISGAGAQTDSQLAESLPADHERLLGGWRVVSIQEDGKDRPTPKGLRSKWIFTEDTLTSNRDTVRYTVNVDVTPFQIDLIPEKRAETRAAIYAFEGEELHFCLGSESEGERPDSLEAPPDSISQLIVLERLPIVADSWPEIELESSLKVDILAAIDLLENDLMEDFLRELSKPSDYRRMEDDKRSRIAGNLRSERSQFLNTFRALLKLEPTMTEGIEEAVFDLTPVHIEGGLDKPEVRLRKFEGKWRVND